MTDRDILNIASELSRANKWLREGNQSLLISSLERTLDLIDAATEKEGNYGLLRELLRLREVLCEQYTNGLRDETTLPSALKSLLDLKAGTHELHLELS